MCSRPGELTRRLHKAAMQITLGACTYTCKTCTSAMQWSHQGPQQIIACIEAFEYLLMGVFIGCAQLAMVLPMSRVQSSQLPRCRTGKMASASRYQTEESKMALPTACRSRHCRSVRIARNCPTYLTGMLSLVLLIRCLREDLQVCDAQGKYAQRCASEEGGAAQSSNRKDDISPQR